MTQRFAEPEDLAVLGLPAEATQDLPAEGLEQHLDSASDLAWSYISGRGYPEPLPTWGNDLRSAVCRIAALEILIHYRGVNIQDPAHAAVLDGHTKALVWLRDVAKGVANLQGVSTARVRSGVASVITDEADSGEATRGW